MVDMEELGRLAWRDWSIDGNPASGLHQPLNADIRTFVAAVGQQKAHFFAAVAAIRTYRGDATAAFVASRLLGDRGGGPFVVKTGDAKTPDDGALVIVDALGRRWWRLYDTLNVCMFGALGDGRADDGPSLDAAVDAVDVRGGGVLVVPPGTYRRTTSWVIGNGSNAAQATKHHRVQIMGSGIGTGPEVSAIQAGGITRIVYDGPPDTSRGVIEFAGPLHSVRLENLMLDCNDGKRGFGFVLNHCTQSKISRIVTRGYAAGACKLTTRSGFPAGAPYGCGDNVIEQIYGFDPANHKADGIIVTSGVAGTLVGRPSSCRNTFIGGTIFYGGSVGSAGIRVAGADNNTFIGILPIPVEGNDGRGHRVYFERWDQSPAFPLENFFCLVAGAQPIGGTSGTGGNFLWPLPTSDGGGAVPDAMTDLSYITEAALRAKQIVALAHEEGGFEGRVGALRMFGLTRSKNGTRLSSFDDVKVEAAAVRGPGSGVNVATFTGSGVALSSGKYVKTTPVTVATLPSAVAAGVGARMSVSDAKAPAFRAVVAGGGKEFTSVISDGSNWLIG